MTRSRVIWLSVTGLLVVLVVWIGSHTYWADSKIPMPPKGEALTNPFYAAEKCVRALGARATHDRVFAAPPSDAVVVLSGWHWSVVRTRREALERWVESGGRLVVDRELVTSGDDFEQWSGIKRKHWGADDRRPSRFGSAGCRPFDESFGDASQTATPTQLSMCGVWFSTSLLSDKPVAWALRDESGIQVMRVVVGRGSVTVINATPFRYQSLFDGDHGRLLVAATELRRGDSVHFLSEGDSPTLLALVWQSGAPVVVLSLGILLGAARKLDGLGCVRRLRRWRHWISPLRKILRRCRRLCLGRRRRQCQQAERSDRNQSPHGVALVSFF